MLKNSHSVTWIWLNSTKIFSNFDLFNHFLSHDCIQKFITFSGAYTDCRPYFHINFAWQILECLVDNKNIFLLVYETDKKGANFYFQYLITCISPANRYSFQYTFKKKSKILYLKKGVDTLSLFRLKLKTYKKLCN